MSHTPKDQRTTVKRRGVGTEGSGCDLLYGICMEGLSKVANLNVASRPPRGKWNPRTTQLRSRRANHQVKRFGDITNADV
jgi:hypothetical protein